MFTVQYQFALLYQFYYEPTGSTTLPNPPVFLFCNSISHMASIEGQLNKHEHTKILCHLCLQTLFINQQQLLYQYKLYSDNNYILFFFSIFFYCLMNPNQDDQQNQAYQQCELCLADINAAQTYAGVFTRICKDCHFQQIQDLEQPIQFIKDGIYIGNYKASRNQLLLKEKEIGAICVCGSDLQLHNYQNLKVQRYVVKLLDTLNQNLIDHIPQAISWMKEMRKKNLNILVHCAGGVSRSASICIAFFMNNTNFDFQTSYLLVKRGRKCVKPNQNFVKQLKAYQKTIEKS